MLANCNELIFSLKCISPYLPCDEILRILNTVSICVCVCVCHHISSEMTGPIWTKFCMLHMCYSAIINFNGSPEILLQYLVIYGITILFFPAKRGYRG